MANFYGMPHETMSKVQIERENTRAVTVFDAEVTDEVREQISKSETSEAGAAYNETLKKISDKELSDEIDSAVGRLIIAYEKYGFVTGWRTRHTCQG